MRRISKVIILTIIVILLSSCGNKSYVVFDYNCDGIDYHKCELKNNKLNCNVETPSCGEYKFIGWFRANEYTNQVDLNGTFSKNEIIYARWEKENGITESSSQIEPTSTIITPGIIDIPSSSKEEPSSSETPSSSKQQVTPPTPVNPSKPEETYTITFNLNGGTGGQRTPISGVKYNQILPSINQTKPTRSGYTFMGWYDKTTGGTQYYNSSNSGVRKYDKKSNLTLYAQWKINVLSIQYNGNSRVWNSTNTTYGVNSSNTVIELSRYSGCDLSKTNCTITVKVNWKKEVWSVTKDYGTGKWTYYGRGSDKLKKYYSNALAFAEYVPEKTLSSGDSLPLIIYLHGLGVLQYEYVDGVLKEKCPYSFCLLGDTFLRTIGNWDNTGLKNIPAVIMAPHLNLQGWGRDEPVRTIDAMISYAKNTYNIDIDKVVLMGHSHGGYGVSSVLASRNTTFSALVIMSGSTTEANPKVAPILKVIPLKGYSENSSVGTGMKSFFNSIGRIDDLTIYTDTTHSGTVAKALKEDKNNDKISDLIYWATSQTRNK